MPVPVNVQLSLFTRILTFDRTFEARSKKDVVIGILYQRTFRPSLNVKENIIQALQASNAMMVADKPVRVIEIDITENSNGLSAETLKGVDILYITPLRAITISSITAMSRALRIRSITGVPEYVDAGIAVGIGTRGDRPEILINLASAKLEGAEYSSQLLKLAKVIQP